MSAASQEDDPPHPPLHASTVEPMADVRERSSIDDSLHLALDLCLALGAFVVGLTGAVHSVVSTAMLAEDGTRRIELLASSCLSHPAAHGRELFWNAEVSTEADAADRSLACVVVPIWAGATQVGLLGIVDTWLPEPDEEQSDGLRSLAEVLATTVPRFLSATRVRHVSGGEHMTDPPVASPMPARAESDVMVDDPFLLRAVFDGLPDAVVVTGQDRLVVAANDAFAALCGRARGDLIGADLGSIMTSDVRDTVEPALAAAAPSAGGRRVLFTADGEDVVVRVSERRIVDAHGGELTVVELRPTALDPASIAAVQLDAAELVGHLDDGVLCLDSTGVVVLANAAADAMHGMPPGRTLVGAPFPMATALRTEDGKVLTHDHHPGLRALRDGTPCVAHLTIGADGDGQRHVEVRARPVSMDGFHGVLVVLHDTTAEWLEQERLTHYALYDPLTGLANRYLLLEELRRMLQGLGRRGGTVALVYLDLDDFKCINDEHGHDMGDEVLSAVARRLRGAVRRDDVVCRLGGDEFVIAHASSEVPDGDLVVSRLRKVMSAPFRVRGQAFEVGVSVGWVSTDRDDVGPDALLAQADRAMYRHKRDRASARRPVR